MDIYRIKHQPLSRIFVTSKTVKLNIEAVVALGMTFKAEETMPDGTHVMMMVAEDGKPLRGIAAFNKTFLVKAERVLPEAEPELLTYAQMEELIHPTIEESDDVPWVDMTPEESETVAELRELYDATAASDSSPVVDVVVNRDNEYPLTDMKAVRSAIRTAKTLTRATQIEILVFGTASIVKYLDEKGIKKLHNGPMTFDSALVESAGNKWITLKVGDEILYAKQWDSTAFVMID